MRHFLYGANKALTNTHSLPHTRNNQTKSNTSLTNTETNENSPFNHPHMRIEIYN